MATTKKSTAKKRKPAAKKPTKAQLQAKRELNAIILFALGVLLLLLAAIPGDNAWNTVHNVLRGLMGWCCYLMGPLMMIVAVLLTMDRTAITPGLKSASVVLMVLLLCGITHIIGTIASGNYFVDEPAKVEEVIRATGADAVEMEGAAVAQVAARNDVPALVIRALSDNADTDYEEFKGFDISEYANTAANLTVDLLRRL